MKSIPLLLDPFQRQIYTRKDYYEFKLFLADSQEFLEGSKEAIQQTLEIILTNVQWQERNYDKLTRTIKHFL